jgi:hypothetical protein
MFQGTDDELILTNKSDKDLKNNLLRGFIAGLILSGVGLISGLAGIVLVIQSAVQPR